VDLHAHVVPATVVARRRHDDEGVVLHRQHRRRGVDVTTVGEELVALVGAHGIHALDLLAGHEPQDVEVVDRAVAEEAAGGGDVCRVRRTLVMGRRADRVDEAQLAGLHGLAQAAITVVEAALEADVDRHVRLSSQLRQLDRALQVTGDRLLAEGRHARGDRGLEQVGVGVGAGGDDEAVDAGGEQLLDAAHRRGADLIGHPGS